MWQLSRQILETNKKPAFFLTKFLPFEKKGPVLTDSNTGPFALPGAFVTSRPTVPGTQ